MGEGRRMLPGMRQIILQAPVVPDFQGFLSGLRDRGVLNLPPSSFFSYVLMYLFVYKRKRGGRGRGRRRLPAELGAPMGSVC